MTLLQKHNLEKGAIFMSLSGISGSFFAMFIKLGLQIPFISFLVTFRFVLPFLMILPFAYFYKVVKREEFWSEIKKQSIRGVAVALGQYSFFYYLMQASLLDATMILNISTIFIIIIARLIYRHHVSTSTWIACAVAFVGVMLILKPDDGIFNWYSFLGLFSAFCLAVSQIIYGLHAEQGRLIKNVFYFLLIPSVLTMVAALFEYFFQSSKADIAESLFSGFNILFLLGIAISSLVNQMLRGIAYSNAKPAVLAPFLYIAVVFSAFLDWALFGHIPDLITILGVVIVLLSSLFQLILNKD